VAGVSIVCRRGHRRRYAVTHVLRVTGVTAAMHAVTRVIGSLEVPGVGLSVPTVLAPMVVLVHDNRPQSMNRVSPMISLIRTWRNSG
jgi:hypothetical protein